MTFVNFLFAANYLQECFCEKKLQNRSSPLPRSHVDVGQAKLSELQKQ